MSKKRKQYSPQFKAKVALEAIRGDKTVPELASLYELHPTVINGWKRQLLELASLVFEKQGKGQMGKEDPTAEINELYRQIGQLKVERDFLGRQVSQTGVDHRKALVVPNHPKLTISTQCELLKLSRSTYYYQAQETSSEELMMLRLLDKQYLKTPFYGSRKMTKYLIEQGYEVNRKRVIRLMRKLGLQAVYPKKRTTIPNQSHKIYPYLLRDLAIAKSNQVWCTDITYLPVRKGHFYLVAIMDWFSRKTLSWRISNTMEVDFCLDALSEALSSYGKPEIFNSDQGSQFTSIEFTQRLKEMDVKISMDGRGRCHDNIFIERLWRSIKYELIYLFEFNDGNHLKQEVKKWFKWYNAERFHQALNYQTPDTVYWKSLKGN
ncbi:MAG: IS3 family transposase [Cyanobacteria bacterium P01_G01_bin.49]